MILTIFTVLVIIALIMVWLGYAIDIPVYSTVGFFLMFMLSLNIINNDIQYQTGFNESVNALNVTTQSYNYASYGDRVFGIYLALASGIGMVLVIINGTDFGHKFINNGAR